MDISQNLARIGNWTADSYESKKSLIQSFLTQTDQYLQETINLHYPQSIKELLNKFQKEFEELKKEKITPQNKEAWAERALTWANILTHRAKLVTE